MQARVLDCGLASQGEIPIWIINQRWTTTW